MFIIKSDGIAALCAPPSCLHFFLPVRIRTAGPAYVPDTIFFGEGEKVRWKRGRGAGPEGGLSEGAVRTAEREKLREKRKAR